MSSLPDERFSLVFGSTFEDPGVLGGAYQDQAGAGAELEKYGPRELRQVNVVGRVVQVLSTVESSQHTERRI